MVAIVTRAQWGARHPKSRKTIGLPTRGLWLHHFATDAWHGAAGMRACQKFHMDSRGWSDIGYSFCVDLDGTIYEGRGVGIAGAHTNGHNSTSHAISWMANTDVHRPTRAMIDATARLAAHGRRQGWWGEWTGGHQQAAGAATSCPGRHGMAALADIRSLTATYIANGSHPQEDDMTPAQEAKLDELLRLAKQNPFHHKIANMSPTKQPAESVIKDIQVHARRAAAGVDLDALADKIAQRVGTGADVTAEAIARAVADEFAGRLDA